MTLCTDIQFFTTSTGGTPLDPVDITFVRPTSSSDVQTVTLYAQNNGLADIPYGALVYMASPRTLEGPDQWWYKRMQDCNTVPNIQFSTDNINWYSRAYLPAMVVGAARVPVYVQYNPPGWDNRVEMGGGFYAYPGDDRDWPPRVRLEVAVKSHVLHVESFEHWADNDHPDNFLIATKWDQIWLNVLTDTYLDNTGGVRGGKAFHCYKEQMGLEKSWRGTTVTNTEMFNITNFGVSEGCMMQFKVRLGEGMTWTDPDVLIAYIDTTKFFSGGYVIPVYWWMGLNGHILAKIWDGGQTTVADVTPTWSYEDYVTLGLAIQLHPNDAAPNDQYEYSFYVNGNVVAHGTQTQSDPYLNPANRVYKVGIGPFEYTQFTGKVVRMRFSDVVIAEPAGPLNTCYFSDYRCLWLPVSSDGAITDWPTRHPTGVSPFYTYIDDSAWNETDWISAQHNYPTGLDYSARPVTTFGFSSCPSAPLYAVQPMYIGGATTTGSGGSSNYSVTPLLHDPAVGTPAVVNEVNVTTGGSGPWQISYAPLECDPYTGLSWTAAALNRLQVGALVAGCAYNDGYLPTITQAGVEVLVGPTLAALRSSYARQI